MHKDAKNRTENSTNSSSELLFQQKILVDVHFFQTALTRSFRWEHWKRQTWPVFPISLFD